jgi:preprotein translocase subunit Sec63
MQLNNKLHKRNFLILIAEYILKIKIKNSYRRLCLRWHPKLTNEKKETSYHHFKVISEAYEVLSDRIISNFVFLFMNISKFK